MKQLGSATKWGRTLFGRMLSSCRTDMLHNIMNRLQTHSSKPNFQWIEFLPSHKFSLRIFKTLHIKSYFNFEYKVSYYWIKNFYKGSIIISLSSYQSNWPNIYFFAPTIDSSSPMFLLMMKFVILQWIDFKCFLSKFNIFCYEEIQGCHYS